MNHKQPTTYCNKTDKALIKALFYLDQLCLHTEMAENFSYQELVSGLEAYRALLNTTVKAEANMHPQDWKQKRAKS